MAVFPVSSIQPERARISKGPLSGYALEVDFSPLFVCAEGADADPLEFKTSLRADFIDLPTVELAELQNRTFDFPCNPEEGYIDASVYFMDVHNPVDITSLRFGELTDGALVLTVVSRWILSFEGTGFEDFDLTFSVPLRQKTPVSTRS
jgi:hypothetical protein